MMATVRRALSRPARQLLRRATVPGARVRMAVGVRPLSDRWAFDRGLPIHRYYVHAFLQEHTADIRGRCLEFQTDRYTRRFAGGAITGIDILHLDASNPRASIVADLTRPNDIPSGTFDCIVCTHVLHIIPDVEAAVSDLHRILAPEGRLLVAVPLVSMCDLDTPEVWRFAPDGLRRLLARAFGPENVTVRAYGNSLAAAAEIRGLAAHELTRGELDTHDPRFPVELCARAVKRGAAP